ncbi:ATP phosphoribosyltransferase regulatory subunit, partial [Flavobacteriaceae bacterium]|nr:ATP phosphoribosyltransferase regulatory subunit [Flavobacteriaceae bacterium]
IDFTVALDKLDKIGQEGVVTELTNKGFSPEALTKLSPLFELQGDPKEKMLALDTLFHDNTIGQEGLQELRFILQQFEKYQFKAVVLDLDLTLARGLHYYTGMIVEVTPPASVKMGSIGGGGRYDDLTSTFGLKNMSGIGVSFGFERIYLVLEALDLFPKNIDKATEVLFVNFGPNDAASAFEAVMKLRNHGISCELYPSDSKLKKQLNYANQKNIPLVVLMGSEEIERQEFDLKDMNSGEQKTHKITELIEIVTQKRNAADTNQS